LKLSDQRITKEGVIVIKAQEHRSQEQNREEALQRLQDLIKSAIAIPKPRKPSKPTRVLRGSVWIARLSDRNLRRGEERWRMSEIAWHLMYRTQPFSPRNSATEPGI
jgi:protein subunit release factor B